MKILIAAAHPDDEVLGCGGPIARHVAAGDEVHILIVCEGSTSRDDPVDGEVAELRNCAQAAAKTLGAQQPVCSGFPDNRLDSMDRLDVIKEVERHIHAIHPDTVYTHHGGDLNIDHRIVHEAVITACRPLPGSPVKRIFSFEAVSSTEWSTIAIGTPFVPFRYIDISGFVSLKIDALQCYSSELRPFPHPRSIKAVEAQAMFRGSQSGFDAAESFQTELDLSF